MTRTISTIRKQIRALRKKEVKWVKVCKSLKILKADGEPDTGLAFDIADSDAYYPSTAEVCKRLGIKRVCPSCKRAILGDRHTHVGLVPMHQAWWKSLKPDERDRHIQNLWKESMND